jgi:hypothetical protein
MLERGDDESADADASGRTRSCVCLLLVASAPEEDCLGEC